MYIGLHIKYPLFLSDFNKIWVSFTDFRKILKHQNSRKPAQWEPSCSTRTEGLICMTKLIVSFRNFAKSPVNVSGKSSLENQNTHFTLNNFSFPKIMPFMKCGKIFLSRSNHKRQYGASALHAGYLRLQTHSQNM
jgi:hypothetical protein